VNFIDSSLEHWAEEYYGGNLQRPRDVKQAWNPACGSPLRFAQEFPA
jgi:hypothetical protein